MLLVTKLRSAAVPPGMVPVVPMKLPVGSSPSVPPLTVVALPRIAQPNPSMNAVRDTYVTSLVALIINKLSCDDAGDTLNNRSALFMVTLSPNVLLPSARNDPFTSSNVVGVGVPIPTLPVLRIRIRSTFPVRNIIACGVVVFTVASTSG